MTPTTPQKLESVERLCYAESIYFENSRPSGLLVRAGDEIVTLRQQLTTALKELDDARAAFPDTYYADRSIAERIKFMSAGWAKAIECLDNQTESFDKLAIDRDNWKQLCEEFDSIAEHHHYCEVTAKGSCTCGLTALRAKFEKMKGS